MLEFEKKKTGGAVGDVYADKPFVKSRDWMVCHLGGGGAGSSGSTTDTAPWGGQQPFLSDVFQQAQNQYQTYTPQYYGFNGTAGGTPTQTGPSTVAPMNPQETSAISTVGNLGLNGSNTFNQANATATGVAGSNPNANPGNQGYFGLMNGQLTNAMNPSNGALNYFTSGASANNNPAMSDLAATANLNPAGNPGNAALNNYANGSMLSAGNPYFSQMADQIKAQTLPGLMGAFTQGTTDNPNVAYGVTNGLTNAIGGLAYQNYQQGQQNQIAAGNTISGNYNTGVGNNISAAANLGSNYNTGQGNILGAASTASGNYFNSLADQLNAGQGISSNYNTGVGNNLNAANLGNTLYNSQLGGANAALTAGQTSQTQSQNELNNLVNAFNYYQNLPYQQLNQYTNTVNGQYGASTTNTAPAGGFFTSLFS